MRASPRQRFAWLLVAGFLLAQTFGILHHHVHAQRGVVQGMRAHAAAQAMPDAGGQSWVAQLFSGHQKDSPDCRVLDQLAHADLLPAMAAAALPLLPPATFVQALQGAACARWAALFDARGPPAFR